MPPLGPWPRAARIVAAVVGDLGVVVGETGTGLQQQLQGGQNVIRVRRVGGADNRITDTARIDVRVYATDLTAAESTAETIRQRLISGPAGTEHGVLDRARTETGPVEVPGTDPGTYRVVNTVYRVSVRRR